MWQGARYKYWAWLIVAVFMLLVSRAYAWDSSSAYNTIAMSYTANTTITQIINLNATQKSQNSINFVVDVKNGGGRPTHDLSGNPLGYSTQTDSATITIYRYNSAGTLLGTSVSSTYILKNYGSNAGGWSAAPGDNQHPFTQASVTYTGSLADTAYIKIEMKGTDGAWWAGNYGAQWRTPTVTVGSSTTNIVYNSEFGVASNGVQAQGWTPSYGSWSACGVTSGNNTCVTQQAGVTANMWGGGEDLNGGTTNGAAGGYSGTLTSSNATQAAAGTLTPGGSTNVAPAPNIRPTWPVINRAANQIQFGANRNPVWQSWWCDNYWGCGNTFNTTYLNWNQGVGDGFHNYNFTYMRWPGTDNGVSKTIWFRVGFDDNSDLRINGQWVAGGGYCGNGCYRYGSYTAKPGEIVKLEFWSDNNGGNTYIMSVAWDPDGDGVYTLLGSTDVGLQSPTEGGGSYWYSSDITADQTTIMNSARSRVSGVQLGNRIYFEEKAGSANNTVTIEQTGNYNLIQGLSGGDAILDGTGNTINIKQGDVVGRNLIELGVYGNSNSVTIWQSRNITTGTADGTESGGHYAGLGINGNSNTVTIKQGNEGGANSGHVGLMYIKGDSNNMTLRQAGNGDKKAFISVDGNNNSSSIYQYGVGSSHYVDLIMTGNGHTANVTQSGTATHKATINLTNAGGSSILNLTQQGSVGQQYSIMQQCANLNGCSVTLTQGGP